MTTVLIYTTEWHGIGAIKSSSINLGRESDRYIIIINFSLSIREWIRQS